MLAAGMESVKERATVFATESGWEMIAPNVIVQYVVVFFQRINNYFWM
jgi:hypothetical protein